MTSKSFTFLSYQKGLLFVVIVSTFLFRVYVLIQKRFLNPFAQILKFEVYPKALINRASIFAALFFADRSLYFND